MGSPTQIIEYLYKQAFALSVHVFTFFDAFTLSGHSNQANTTPGILPLCRLSHILVGHAKRFRGTVTKGLAMAIVTSREADVKGQHKTSPLRLPLDLI